MNIKIFCRCSFFLPGRDKDLSAPLYLVKNFPEFYGTRKFIPMFTTAHPGPCPELDGSSSRPPNHPISSRSISTSRIPTRSKRSVSFCPSRFPSKDLKQELGGHRIKDDHQLQTVARRSHRKQNCINRGTKSSPNDKSASVVKQNMWKMGGGDVTMKCELFVLE
jgi:hypothetical protein